MRGSRKDAAVLVVEQGGMLRTGLMLLRIVSVGWRLRDTIVRTSVWEN